MTKKFGSEVGEQLGKGLGSLNSFGGGEGKGLKALCQKLSISRFLELKISSFDRGVSLESLSG